MFTRRGPTRNRSYSILESCLTLEKARKNVVTSVGHFISWVAEIVVFGGIEYVVTTALHGDALGRQTYMTSALEVA